MRAPDAATTAVIERCAATAAALADGTDAAVISAVLERLHWRVLEFGHRELAAGEAVHDAARPGIRFHYVASGALELRRSGDDPLSMQAGDFVLLPDGGEAHQHATTATMLLSGSLALDGGDAIVAEAMPRVLFTCGFRVHEPIFASLLDTMHRESSSGRPGSGSVIERLADIVASAAVRIWLERGCGDARAWLAPARDPHLGRALDAIHDDPGSPWTVESLARLASASRSQFAEQFKDAVGDTPARYLTRVRMERAEGMLRTGASVTDIAYQLGYESDAGFSRAFRRYAGVAPSRWRLSASVPS
ncbi:AraC family transcriptional regulator [Agromyces subbeticus]|uniref:AraC family transcriptional regulator n=1 Tax=Agromyces subbeticus TaxID=293890 RepID=UPI0003B473FD|nr:AraC family transcriptional regulator [Agromyces subbeticus]